MGKQSITKVGPGIRVTDSPNGAPLASAMAFCNRTSPAGLRVSSPSKAVEARGDLREAGRWTKDEPVLLCVSGRGDKDVAHVVEHLAERS